MALHPCNHMCNLENDVVGFFYIRGGPMLVIDGVTTPMNGLFFLKGSWGCNPYKWSSGPPLITGSWTHLVVV